MNEISTIKFCRKLRREMTDAEVILWKQLRRSAIGGHKFRRQHPIGPYVADFACLPKRFVIEVDGSTHWNDDARAYDRNRRRYLSELGWREIRMSNDDVFRNLDRVLEYILLTLAANN